MNDLSIRTMRPDEISIAVNWAAAEGWNPGLADDACFAAVDPEGFLIGELDGAPAAIVSCVNYSASFAFLGFYIVREDLRGRGYGLHIWDAAIAHAAPRVHARLDRLARACRLRPYARWQACRLGRDPSMPQGLQIGPLVADDRFTAEVVLSALLASVGGGEIFLDVSSINRDAVALAQDLGLVPVFETARMYTGAIPPLRLERVFGVTTFELG